MNLLEDLNQSQQEGPTLHAAFSLAFSAFCRCGEFTYTSQDRRDPDFDFWHLTQKSITFETDHFTVFANLKNVSF